RKKAIESLRVHLALAQKRDAGLAQLVAAVRGASANLSSDALEVLYLTTQEGTGSPSPLAEGAEGRGASTTVDALLGTPESNGLFSWWNGQRAEHAGQFADAAQAYGRALPPSRYQAEAQLGLLTSLLELAAKDSPKTAADLLDDIYRDNTTDPVVLVGYAEMKRRLDSVQGRESMEAALAHLERTLAPANRGAVAADLLARGYYAAGRTDLARTEAARAVQLNPSYPPALALSARLAAEDSDYETCLRYAEEVERSLYGTADAKREAPVAAAPHSVLDRPQPTLVDGAYWRAVAADKLGRKQEAKRIYQQLIDQHPKLAVGYLGLAELREQANDMPGALDYVRQWRSQEPKDAAGATAEVRLLAKAGKTGEAERAGEAYAGGNAAALVAVARAFADAKAYDQ